MRVQVPVSGRRRAGGRVRGASPWRIAAIVEQSIAATGRRQAGSECAVRVLVTASPRSCARFLSRFWSSQRRHQQRRTAPVFGRSARRGDQGASTGTARPTTSARQPAVGHRAAGTTGRPRRRCRRQRNHRVLVVMGRRSTLQPRFPAGSTRVGPSTLPDARVRVKGPTHPIRVRPPVAATDRTRRRSHVDRASG